MLMHRLCAVLLLTLHSGFMRGEDAGVSAGRGADVQVELDVFFQSEALLFACCEDGLLLFLFAVAKHTDD